MSEPSNCWAIGRADITFVRSAAAALSGRLDQASAISESTCARTIASLVAPGDQRNRLTRNS
jgi:hypothetical protein